MRHAADGVASPSRKARPPTSGTACATRATSSSSALAPRASWTLARRCGACRWRLALPQTAAAIALPGEQLVERGDGQRWWCKPAPAAGAHSPSVQARARSGRLNPTSDAGRRLRGPEPLPMKTKLAAENQGSIDGAEA